MTNPTATIRNFIPDGLARKLALWIAPACVALVLSFALDRSARASEPALLAQATKSPDVIAANGGGACQVAKQYASLINKGAVPCAGRTVR